MLLLTDFGSRGDPNVRGTPGVRLRGPRQNSHIWSILASFLCYYALILGHGAIRMFGEPRGPVTGTSSKLADLIHSDKFSVLLHADFGSRGDPNVRGTPVSGYGYVVKTRIFGPSWPVFYAITHSFWVPGRSECSGNPRRPVTGTSSKLADLVHSDQFSVLLLALLGPGAIRMFGESRCPVTGTSSKLADLIHSDQFSVLLLTDFGSRGDPSVRETPGVRLRVPR